MLLVCVYTDRRPTPRSQALCVSLCVNHHKERLLLASQPPCGGLPSPVADHPSCDDWSRQTSGPASPSPSSSTSEHSNSRSGSVTGSVYSCVMPPPSPRHLPDALVIPCTTSLPMTAHGTAHGTADRHRSPRGLATYHLPPSNNLAIPMATMAATAPVSPHAPSRPVAAVHPTRVRSARRPRRCLTTTPASTSPT